MSDGNISGSYQASIPTRGSEPDAKLRPASLKSRRSRPSFGRTKTRSRSRPGSLRRPDSAGLHDGLGNYIGGHRNAVAREIALASTSEPGIANLTAEDAEKDKLDREEAESDVVGSVHGDAIDDFGTDPTDLEKASSIKRQQTNQTTGSSSNPNRVSWDGLDDPDNPKNWTMKRKWAAVLVVSSFTFISPVSSSMVAPALPDMDRDLGIHDQVTSQMLLSIFILAYAFGPLFLGPLSEVYGRVPVLQLANLFFLIFNTVCGFAQNGTQMLVFRFLAGIGGSAPLAIGGGILADCFQPEQRGKAIGIYSLAPLLGPAIGPIAGGFITQNTTWRWVFFAVSIADAVIQIAGLFFLQETWAPKVLELKVRKMRKETGNQDLYAAASRRETTVAKLKTSLYRPFRLLLTQPIVIVVALYMGYLYGLVYLVISSFPALFTSPDYYGQSTQMGGLNYIALAIGYAVGAQTTARLNDSVYRRLKHRNNDVGKPEFRVPVMIPSAVLLPIGLFMYGWSAEARVHWIVPDIGAAVIGAAIICGYYSIQNYVIDTYTKYAASAIAAITFLRSLAGFGFPLFAPALYNALGYGWGNSVLGFVAIAIGFPSTWVFWHYGAQLRAKSQFAAG